MRTAICLALVLPFAGQAQAACPTAADMDTGVIFTLSDGGYELHKSTDEDWVQIYAYFGDGEASVLDFYHGLYLLTDLPVVDGFPLLAEMQTYATEAQLAEWAAPKPDAEWRNTTSGGGYAKSRGIEPFRLGDCTYEAFDVSLIYADDAGYQETYRYIPALKTGLLIASADETGVERYTYTGVRVQQ